MGWSDIFLGPKYKQLTDYLLKEKEPEGKKAAPPADNKTKTPKNQQLQNTVKTKAPPKDRAAEYFDPGEETTPVQGTGPRPPKRSSSTETSDLVKSFMGGGDDGSGKTMSNEELQALLSMVSKGNVQLPDFDLGIKSAIGDITPEQLGQAPMDIRPVAAFLDDIYGGNRYQRTSNLPKEYFDKLMAVRDLREGSRALQQVKGQAALEKYKVDLQQLTGGSPLQQSQTLLNLVKAKNGGGTGNSALTTAMMGIILRGLEMDRSAQNRDEDIDRGNELEQRKRTSELQNNMRTEIKDMKYAQVRDGINSSRRALMTSKSGVSDYQALVTFIKNLDRDSAVMWGEVEGFQKALGLANRWANYPAEFLSGTRIPPKERDEMLDALHFMQKDNDERLRSKVREYNGIAKAENIKPANVTHPVVTGTVTPEKNVYYWATDKDGKKKKVKVKAGNYYDGSRQIKKDFLYVEPAGGD